MYVAEIVGYPYQPGPGEEPLGRIRLLEDRDGDGRFDVGHIFADRLVWPVGLLPGKGESSPLPRPTSFISRIPTVTARPTSVRRSTRDSASPTNSRWSTILFGEWIGKTQS